MQKLIPEAENLSIEIAFHVGENLLHQRVERLLVRPHGSDPELRSLMQVLVRHLGGGDFEFVADTGLQALDDHPLFFEAPAAGHVEIEEGVCDHHGEALGVGRVALGEDGENFGLRFPRRAPSA